MSSPGDDSRTPAGGRLLRTPAEIARVLETLIASGAPIGAPLEAGKLRFESRLLWIDPERQFFALERSRDPAADAALLARPRCSFTCALGGWHVEFVAADPGPIREGKRGAICLRFPELMIVHQRRAEERVTLSRHLPLHCVADADGVMPFDTHVVDISPAGIGILLYHPGITLEPGTLLRGCMIQRHGYPPVQVDMEVRYSQQVVLKDGRRARRSGCRFVNPSKELKALVRLVTGEALADDA